MMACSNYRSGFVLCLVFVTVGGIKRVDDDDGDVFMCKKVKQIEGRNGACYEEIKGIKLLEKRLQVVETRLLEQAQMLQMPSVIKLQHEDIPRDCHAIYESGQREDGVYQISPDGRCAFNVYCDMGSGGWVVIQRRYDGATDFQRDWVDYVEGFGDLRGEFWLGLEKIHRLTSGGSQIYFTLGDYNASRPDDWAHYESFAVGNLLTGYRMNVDPFGYKGSIKELLSYHNDQKFSTRDRDNDLFSHGCSERYGGGGGWWYNSCYRLGILNGLFGVQGSGGMSIWQHGPVYVKTTEIRVKPRLDSRENECAEYR